MCITPQGLLEHWKPATSWHFDFPRIPWFTDLDALPQLITGIALCHKVENGFPNERSKAHYSQDKRANRGLIRSQQQSVMGWQLSDVLWSAK